MPQSIHHYPTPAVLTEAAAALFARCAHEAITARGRFSVALAGGSTPRPVYARLTQPPYPTDVDWSRVHFFFGDERCVPPTHARSNYRMASESMFQSLPISPENIHRMQGELSPQEAAACYAETLRAFFGASQPQFDLVLLGLGTDGHTASLFPNSAALEEDSHSVVANFAPSQQEWRLTLTYPAINAARCVAFLVAGEAKRPILHAVLHGESGHYPAQRIQPHDGSLLWMLSP
ncbi:MAG: 6-phosphogluconolactonase [Anaerolineae bacterium]|nr:MAG: 6-phosphogluconolactonase [Anaerolineae bacterium]